METERRILLVEDEAILALQMKEAIRQMGYCVTGVCASGEKALESVERQKPDLVLMDINIQGEMDGIETARMIRERYEIPSVFLTAHSDESTIARAKIVEPYGYLLKPVNTKELQIAIDVALYKSRLDREKAQLTRDLQQALEKVKLLSGILPICCSCKKIRNDQGYWEQIEVFIRDHSNAEFSHGICDECRRKLYEDVD
ncbi:MAG TPA: response regulator [Candidatus Ozemobacteraceae bacterium]|nr:response regulator [Candidatus Ozemobacteraceae bacterium]